MVCVGLGGQASRRSVQTPGPLVCFIVTLCWLSLNQCIAMGWGGIGQYLCKALGRRYECKGLDK